jgi:hypothetical protein
MPSLVALSRNLGSNNNAIRKVDITLTVIVLSYPSNSSNLPVAIPAFSITTSRRFKVCARAQNVLTLSKDVKSTCQTSTTFDRSVVLSMSAFATSPFSVLLQARITFAAFSRTKCRATSRPKPQFAPVTMMVWPVKSPSGYGR